MGLPRSRARVRSHGACRSRGDHNRCDCRGRDRVLAAHVPTTESAVSVRTLVRPAETASEPPGPMEAGEQAVLNQRSTLPQVDAIQLADAVTSRSSASATTKALEGIAVSATTTTATDDTPVKKATAGSVAVVGVPTRDPMPTKIQSTKELDVTSRYASHGEPLQLAGREHYLKRS